MKARVRSVRWEAQDILGFRLEPLPGAHLAPFTAGAHVDVALRPGLTRSYSLLNDPREHGAYEIAVQLDPATRGGSRHIHEEWRAGQLVEVSEPRNNFPLEENSAHTVLLPWGWWLARRERAAASLWGLSPLPLRPTLPSPRHSRAKP